MTRTAALKQQWPHHDQQKQHAATTPSMLCAGPLPLCSVCLEMVRDDGGGRAIVKLKCGHQFHLAKFLMTRSSELKCPFTTADQCIILLATCLQVLLHRF